MNHKEEFLSKNQQIIFDFIEKAKEPLKAYSILFNVQKKGIKAPLQVYRALDKLVEIGKIHKVESRNAFIACKSASFEISQLALLHAIKAFLLSTLCIFPISTNLSNAL